MKTTAQVRQLTVITRNRETGRVPEIRMAGRWLRESGFAPGSRLAITVERRRRGSVNRCVKASGGGLLGGDFHSIRVQGSRKDIPEQFG
jgi:Toxin SymE, type I toxin-antitoxin system